MYVFFSIKGKKVVILFYLFFFEEKEKREIELKEMMST